MDREEVEHEVHAILNPEPDELPDHGMYAPSSLRKRHKDLDFAYLNTGFWEGCSSHEYTRICSSGDPQVSQLQRNLFVPENLLGAALRTFGDSIVAYHGRKERFGQLHYYPQVILTFWSGFETFVRAMSELYLVTCRDIPVEVRYALLEQEPQFDSKANVETRRKNRPPLERYRLLLKYGYGFEVERGATYWQDVAAAQKLRDYYTHLDLGEARSVSTGDVLTFMESILMAIIRPSVALKRTLLLNVYFIYDMWAALSRLSTPFTEQPVLKDMNFQDSYGFHCNFENIDASRFPAAGPHGNNKA